MGRQMRNTCAAVLILFLASPVLAGNDPGTGVQRSPHDLRRDGQVNLMAPSGESVCFYCHTPHNTTAPTRAVASFATYSSASASFAEPGGVSRICLGCHDGSIAVSVYGTVPADPVARAYPDQEERVPPMLAAPTGLSKHHPIGFDYDGIAMSDTALRPSTTALRGTNPTHLTIEDLLWSGRMECTTCHDVHNTRNEGKKFTWVEDQQSNLCFTCHNK